MLSCEWLLPLPSSLVQTIVVLSSMVPSPPGSGVASSLLARCGELLAEPGVDLAQFLLTTRIAVGVVREPVVTFLDAEPAHARLADGVGELERGDAGHVVGQRVDQQVDLHAADLRHVVVVELHAGFERRRGMRAAFVRRHAASRSPSRARTWRAGRAALCPRRLTDAATRRRSSRHFVEHAAEALAVLHLPVELFEHLVGIADRRERLVRPGVDPARPRVGAVRHGDAQFERAKARARLGPALQEVFDLLVDRDAARPSRRACRSRPGCCRGTSSMPVSRQLIPRMWPSPSPRILFEMPLSVSRRFLNGSSGARMRLSREIRRQLPSGQKSGRHHRHSA